MNLQQIKQAIEEGKTVCHQTQFYRVINPGDFIPDQLGIQNKNLKTITYDEFNKIIPGCTYTDENLQKTTI